MIFETILSDFHKLTKLVNYRGYRKFRNYELRAQLDSEILRHNINNVDYQYFLSIFIEFLNKHVPMKQKYLRANHGRFMTKNKGNYETF